MVFHNLKAIYFHIGKTAGTTVERLFSNQPYFDPMVADFDALFGLDTATRSYLQHATAWRVKELMDEELFDTYLKFTIVRNPFVRSLSVFHYLYYRNLKECGSFEGFIESLPQRLKSAEKNVGDHYLPQVYYTHINDQLICDYVGKFEALPHSLSPVMQSCGIQQPVRITNKVRVKNWDAKPIASYYTPNMIHIMQDLYGQDFEAFNYSTDPEDIEFDSVRVNSAKARHKLGSARNRLKKSLFR